MFATALEVGPSRVNRYRMDRLGLENASLDEHPEGAIVSIALRSVDSCGSVADKAYLLRAD
jgi:hypothetical protein